MFIEFKKISYDKILTDNQKSYQLKHPNVPFHEVIDIIRSQADKEYLDSIRESNMDEDSSSIFD